MLSATTSILNLHRPSTPVMRHLGGGKEKALPHGTDMAIFRESRQAFCLGQDSGQVGERLAVVARQLTNYLDDRYYARALTAGSCEGYQTRPRSSGDVRKIATSTSVVLAFSHHFLLLISVHTSGREASGPPNAGRDFLYRRMVTG